jgi:hypothetical protein
MPSISHEDYANHQIDEELVSVDSLKHVLFTRCDCKEVHIQREQHDPPDFTVTIDGESFPAEVTSIVSRQQYRAQCKEFAEAIRDSADSLGILSGRYAFIVSRLYRIPKPTSKKGRQFIEKAVAYVDATRQQANSPEIQLAQDNSGKISIAKIAANGSSIGVLWIVPGMREGDIHSQLTMMIQQAVDDKMRKLQDAGIGPRRALLLLYDAFGYAQSLDAVAAMQQITGYDWFHSIFWATSFFDRKNTTYPEEPGREGFFLFSNNPSWNSVGTVPLENGT